MAVILWFGSNCMSFTSMSSAVGEALGKSVLQPFASLGYCKLPWLGLGLGLGLELGVGSGLGFGLGLQSGFGLGEP